MQDSLAHHSVAREAAVGLGPLIPQWRGAMGQALELYHVTCLYRHGIWEGGCVWWGWGWRGERSARTVPFQPLHIQRAPGQGTGEAQAVWEGTPFTHPGEALHAEGPKGWTEEVRLSGLPKQPGLGGSSAWYSCILRLGVLA